MAGSKFKMYENLVFLTQIGISMVVPILGGLLIGKFIDEKVGTNSIFMLSFIVLGVVVAFMNVYKMVMRDYRKKDK
ncbi:MAG: F0F1 ATP synthase subunit [Clostridiales bacterium]|nr:MAG: F0F1 ATP synthase subunit [Clostridiales bacterium]